MNGSKPAVNGIYSNNFNASQKNYLLAIHAWKVLLSPRLSEGNFTFQPHCLQMFVFTDDCNPRLRLASAEFV